LLRECGGAWNGAPVTPRKKKRWGRSAPFPLFRKPQYCPATGTFGDAVMFKTFALFAVTAAFAVQPALAQDLPDLGGRTIHAVTENAYYPLNFADPKTGEGIGLEYDVINEIAKRLNAKVEWNL